MIGYADIQTFVMVLFAIFAAIITIDKMVDIIKKYKQPGVDVSREIDDIKKHLHNDNLRISSLEEGQRLTLRGINALLEHNIDGNPSDKKRLENAKDDITDFLINKS